MQNQIFDNPKLVCKRVQLVTKRVAHEDATIEWVDGNIGSKLTMKYPRLLMRGSHAEVFQSHMQAKVNIKTLVRRFTT